MLDVGSLEKRVDLEDMAFLSQSALECLARMCLYMCLCRQTHTRVDAHTLSCRSRTVTPFLKERVRLLKDC